MPNANTEQSQQHNYRGEKEGRRRFAFYVKKSSIFKGHYNYVHRKPVATHTFLKKMYILYNHGDGI